MGDIENRLENSEMINKNKILIDNLNSCKNHLNFKFKKNLSFSSDCSDHCVTHALSDTKDTSCIHSHSRKCEECNTLDFILEEIADQINENFLDEKQRDNFNHELNQEKEKIYEWKHHLIRNWAQDRIKYEKLKNLGEDECWIIFDWAMKVLEQRFRETQKEFFAKKGMSMHVTCVIFKKDQKNWTLTFVHLLNRCSQDLNSVIGILDHVLEKINSLIGTKVNFKINF